MIADFSAADLKTTAPGEIIRVLAPHGKAIIGLARPGTGVTAAQLLAWAKQAQVPAVPVENELGSWVILTKPGIPGGDDWTHWNHGPDNNPLTADTARTWPSMVQWFGRPYNRERNGLLLAAGGRIFTASKLIPSYAQPETPAGEVFKGDTLVARDGCNGRVLWSHPLTYPPSFLLPVWIATADRFYAASGGTVLVIDSATGKEIQQIPVGDDSKQIVWMSISDRTLYLLAGEKLQDAKKGRGGSTELEAQAVGTQIVAWSLAQNKELWRHTASAPVDARAVAISGGRLFAYAQGAWITALDAVKGSVLWKFEDPAVLGSMTKTVSNFDNSVDGITLYRAGMIATPRAVIVNLNSRENRMVFDAATGKVLWESKLTGGNGGRGGTMLVMNDRLIAKGMPGPIRAVLTGEEIKEKVSTGGGCGRFVGTPQGLIGMLDSFYDLGKACELEDSMIKPDCHIGTIVSNGISFTPPGNCRCAMSLRGFLAECSRPDETALNPMNDNERLQTFSGAAGAATIATDKDWPVYRGNDQHSGSTPVAIGSGTLSGKWVSEPCDAEFTPPISVGDRTFVAGDDGVIRCFDSNTGKQLWRYATAGRVRVAPSYWQGRIYAGSADGYVYCLSAETGLPFWRFCAAPTQRRVMIMDRLSSTWPVNSGVVVREGSVYAVAGFTEREGVHVWALDAKSGQIRWHNARLGELGMMPMGNITVAGQYLWLRTASGMPALDLKTGELAPAPEFGKPGGRPRLAPSVRGCEIGVINDRFIIQGGLRQFSDQWERTLGRSNNFGLIEVDDKGSGKYPMIRPLAECALMPVWDSKLMLVGVEQFRKAKKLEAWETPKLIEWAAAERGKMEPDMARTRNAETTGGKSLPSAVAWGPVDYDINAAAIASDVVALVAGTHTAKSPWVPDGWQIATLDRSGTSLWQANLPAEPMNDGLCIDHNGRVIVAMANGSLACFGR